MTRWPAVCSTRPTRRSGGRSCLAGTRCRSSGLRAISSTTRRPRIRARFLYTSLDQDPQLDREAVVVRATDRAGVARPGGPRGHSDPRSDAARVRRAADEPRAQRARRQAARDEHAARGIRRCGPAPRVAGDLRRDDLCRHAAHARDGVPHRSRRDAGTARGAHRPRRSAAVAHRRRHWRHAVRPHGATRSARCCSVCASPMSRPSVRFALCWSPSRPSPR